MKMKSFSYFLYLLQVEKLWTLLVHNFSQNITIFRGYSDKNSCNHRMHPKYSESPSSTRRMAFSLAVPKSMFITLPALQIVYSSVLPGELNCTPVSMRLREYFNRFMWFSFELWVPLIFAVVWFVMMLELRSGECNLYNMNTWELYIHFKDHCAQGSRRVLIFLKLLWRLIV